MCQDYPWESVFFVWAVPERWGRWNLSELHIWNSRWPKELQCRQQRDCWERLWKTPSFLTPVRSGVTTLTVPSPGKLACRPILPEGQKRDRHFLSILPAQSQWFLESWDWHLLFKNKQTKSVRLNPSSLIKVHFPPDLFPIKGSYEKHFGFKSSLCLRSESRFLPKASKILQFLSFLVFDWSLSFAFLSFPLRLKTPLVSTVLSETWICLLTLPFTLKAKACALFQGYLALLLLTHTGRTALFPLCFLLHRGSGTPQLQE